MMSRTYEFVGLMLANTNTFQNTHDRDQRLELYENNLFPDMNLLVFEPISQTVETGYNNGGLTIATGFNTNQGSHNNTLGRVRNRGGVDINGNIIKSGKHNEYTPDNAIKKCKTMIVKEIFNSVNDKIVQKEGMKPGILKNTLMKMNQKQIVKCTANDNKSFLHKTVGEILSEDISRGNFPKKHNKIIIENLSKKYKEFEILFSITFLDCLKYFRGETIEKQEYIEGMKNYSQIKDDIKNKKGEYYADYINTLLDNFESIVINQKPRKCKEDRKSVV